MGLMLELKPEGPGVRIGDSIRVRLVNTAHGVRVVIDAPADMRILRESLLNPKEETHENRQARRP